MRDKFIQGYFIFSLATNAQLEIWQEKFIRYYVVMCIIQKPKLWWWLNENRDARCRKWDMGCEKWEIRCWKWGFWMLTSHFPLPTWHFYKKKLNWVPRNGEWDFKRGLSRLKCGPLKGELSTSLGSWIFRLHLLKASAGVEKCMGDISRNCFMWCKIRFTCQLQTIIGYLASKVWWYLKIWRAQIRMLATRCHYFIISPRSPPSWWAHKNLRVSCRHSSSYTSLLQRSAKIDVRGLVIYCHAHVS